MSKHQLSGELLIKVCAAKYHPAAPEQTTSSSRSFVTGDVSSLLTAATLMSFARSANRNADCVPIAWEREGDSLDTMLMQGGGSTDPAR